jgi:hypothetical protein
MKEIEKKLLFSCAEERRVKIDKDMHVGRSCFDVQSLDKNLKRKPTEMMAVFVTT